MLKQIDHVVVIVPELEAAMERATTAGFTVTPGGVHESGLTHHALIIFGDGSYIELYAFLDPEYRGDHRFLARHELGGGLAAFALLSTNLLFDVAVINARGIEFPAPTDLGRRTPEDMLFHWRSSFPAITNPERGYPFLIQDMTGRGLRIPDLDGLARHDNGAIGIAGVTVVVPDLEQAVAKYRLILGGPPDHSTNVGMAGKGVLRMQLPNNPAQWVALMQTFPDTTAEAYYRRFGECPYAVNLRTVEGLDVHPGDGTLIDPELVGGARIYL